MSYNNRINLDSILSRDDLINHYVKKFKDDPELLNEILTKLRKDKIEKIKNR